MKCLGERHFDCDVARMNWSPLSIDVTSHPAYTAISAFSRRNLLALAIS